MKSVIRLSAALVIAILAIVEGEAQTNTIQLRNGANSTTILPSASTTISVQIPALTGGTHYLLTSSTNPGSSGASLDGLSDAKSEGTNFTSSLIIGHQSTGTLSAFDPAERNTALGISAMEAITIGDDNTSAGYASLLRLTEASGNTAVGSWSGYEITTGNSNVMIGAQAGWGIETGIGNIAVGAGGIFRNGDLQVFDVGNYNIAVGFAAMYEGPSGSMNIGLGYAAGNQLLSGQDNVLIGSEAGFNLTTGSSNVFLGFQVGSNATIDTESNLLMIDNSSTLTPLIYGDFSGNTLTFNGAITTTGTSALNGNVTVGGGASASEVRFLEPSGSGSNYSAFKAQVQAADVTYTLPAADGTNGYVLTTNGSGTLSWAAASGGATSIDGLSDAKSGGASFTNSLLLGHQSVTPTDAEQNTGVGLGGVLQALTSGDQNTAVGYGAADGVSSGFLLTAIGYNALGAASSAARIVAIGAQAGESTTTGAYSVFIGNQAAQSFTGASNVVAVGYGAMRLATGGDNVAIGTEALNGLTTGTRNVAIGTYAGNTHVTTGSGNVFIGDRVYPSTNVSDKLYIHNSATDSPLIYGDFSGSTLTFNGSTTTTGKTTFSPPGSAKAITATTSTGAGAPDIAAFTNTYDKVAVTATTAAGYVQLPAGTDGQVLYLRLAFTADASNSTVTVVNSNNSNTAMVYDGTGADVIVAHMLYTTGEGWVVFSALEYDN